MARKLKPRTPIAERLVKAREALSLDRKALAAALDWNLSTLGDYELGACQPSFEFLGRLAGLGISLDWLITGRGEIWSDAALSEGRDAEIARLHLTIAHMKVGAAAPGSLDSVLMGRIVDAIRAAYREQGQQVPDRTLGELAAAWYSEIVRAGDEQADRMMALGAKAALFRQELSATARDPASSKRQA
ncbi:MAG: helix-turn-helix transcriptional regulator [Alphaproteobacteria bacterium]|nr:helix-turn-helix transcriptional regulator [Alphaproteobacteria bacterium]